MLTVELRHYVGFSWQDIMWAFPGKPLITTKGYQMSKTVYAQGMSLHLSSRFKENGQSILLSILCSDNGTAKRARDARQTVLTASMVRQGTVHVVPKERV